MTAQADSTIDDLTGNSTVFKITLNLHYYFLYMCMGRLTNSQHAEARGQPAQVCSLLPPCESGD